MKYKALGIFFLILLISPFVLSLDNNLSSNESLCEKTDVNILEINNSQIQGIILNEMQKEKLMQDEALLEHKYKTFNIILLITSLFVAIIAIIATILGGKYLEKSEQIALLRAEKQTSDMMTAFSKSLPEKIKSFYEEDITKIKSDLRVNEEQKENIVNSILNIEVKGKAVDAIKSKLKNVFNKKEDIQDSPEETGEENKFD